MRTFGVNKAVQSELWALTKEIRERKEIVNYVNDPEGVGSFRFPSAWLDDDFDGVEGYVETIMHLNFCLLYTSDAADE